MAHMKPTRPMKGLRYNSGFGRWIGLAPSRETPQLICCHPAPSPNCILACFGTTWKMESLAEHWQGEAVAS